MTAQEFEFENKKNRLRQEAVDKEVQRLRKISQKQSGKITNLRKALYFQLFFFITLFLVLIFKGIINFKSTSSSKDYALLVKKYELLSKKQSSLSTTLVMYRDSIHKFHDKNIVERGEEGYKYRVQIGAYKEVNLSEYLDDLVAINQETYDSICQYTLGSFDDYSKAVTFSKTIKKMGFKDSFILATKDGKRIQLDQLPKEVRENNKIPTAKKQTDKAEQNEATQL